MIDPISEAIFRVVDVGRLADRRGFAVILQAAEGGGTTMTLMREGYFQADAWRALLGSEVRVSFTPLPVGTPGPLERTEIE